MRRVLNLNLLLVVAVLAILGIVYARPDWIVDPPVFKSATAFTDKSDDSCTGHETAGRCADKCPPGQHAQGHSHGKMICTDDPKGCPWAEQLTFNDPHCIGPGARVYNPLKAPAYAEPFTGK